MAGLDDPISRREVDAIVERVAEASRREVTAAITTVQVQIGASERTLTAKIGSVRAWGIAALLGGQTFAAIAASYVAPSKTGAALHALTSHLPL